MTTEKTYTATAPTGARIIGTVDLVTAYALLNAFKRGPGGAWEPLYSGTTDIDWDTQKQQREDDEKLYLADDGTRWKESELVFSEYTNLP